MTQLSSSLPSGHTHNVTNQIVELLERYHAHHPFLAEALQRHQALTQAMADQRQQAECALRAWQAALARRWSCEVAAQRACTLTQRQLGACCGDDTASSRLLAPALGGVASTPRDLLQEVRRLEATIELLSPRQPFTAEALTRLRAVGDDLAMAIAQTDSCEAERRSLVSSQRVVAALLERFYERARQLLVSHGPNGEQL